MIDDDEAINVIVDQVDVAFRALKAEEVDLSPKQKNKWKLEDEDDYSTKTKRQFHMVDMEAKSIGLIV